MNGLREKFSGFRGNRAAAAGMIILIVIAAGALLSGFFDEQAGTDLENSLKPPSLEHPFGTDSFGRDLFSRVLRGSRVSLMVGFSARTISLIIGLITGLIAGYYGKRTDSVIMRLADITFAFPTLLLLIAVMAVVTPGLVTLSMVLGLVGWAAIARLVRAQVLAVRERGYVEAARAAGASDMSLLIKHILPQCLSPLIVVYTLGLGMAIMAESSLSFLGLGIQPPDPSWGRMISDGIIFMRSAWWLTIFPGLALTLTVCSLNLAGDGLRDMLDTRRVDFRNSM